MKFSVDQEVFRRLPDYCVGVIVVPSFDNRSEYRDIRELLDESVCSFSKQAEGVQLKEDARIEPYRTAFRLLNINPNKYLCSIEALAKRVQKKPELPHINPLVDLGNAVSLNHVVPIGVHDCASLADGSLCVRFAESEDRFLPMGSEETEQPDVGEPVYVSGHTVKTRRWTWRQSDDSKITAETSSVLIVVDGFTSRNDIQVHEAVEELSRILQKHTGIPPVQGWVDRQHPVFEWESL